MEVAADPYELKLYQMFQNCDAQRSGLLDEQSLRVLCENLELQDKGSSLIANLAAVDGGKTRVSFTKFKEALLNYLGNEFDGSSTATVAATAAPATTTVTTNKNNTTNTNALTTTKTQQSGATATTQTTEKILVISDNAETVIDSPSELSDREVSPKLIVGSKKYGRRSRPGSIRNLEEFALTDSDRGADDESINNRLVQRSSSQTDIPGGGGSSNGRRRRPLVPNGNKLKRCSSLPAQRNMQNLRTSKLITTNTTSGRHDDDDNNEDDDDNDSIEGLLKPPATGMGSSVESLEFCKGVEEIYSTTTTRRDHDVIPPYDGYEPPERWRRYHQAKDSPPTHLESLPIQSIVEIWEQANIPHGRRILLALGFTDSSVNLLQLHKVLDEEIRTIDDDPDQFVRAALSLKSAELAMLRQTYRQLHDENAKLRSDNKEANRRLAYLAAEIDERHASLEETSQREIRLLEQRQANVVRDLTAKMQNDRENWTSLVARMEARVKQFEQNEIKLRTEVELVRRENLDFETEHKRLQKQLAEVLEKNIQLNREIADLEDVSGERDAAELRDRSAANTSAASAVSADEEMVASLMEKISKLQMENTGLRDKNDEYVAELESLTLELKRLKVKAHKKAAAGEAADEGASTADDSEHSGAGATATKRRGDSPSKAHVTEESPRLGKLRKCAADGEASEASDASGEWMALNSELKQVHAGSEELVAELRQKIADLEEKLAASQVATGDKEPSSKSPTPEERCKELELSLEQMQRAYEDCEDYWQSKLSEERQLFEKERQLYEDEHQENDKKFTELMEKVREYEEQFSKDGRLSPIEEKYSLEQQYVELEQEVEELREQSRLIIEEKSAEIEGLQSEIEDLRLRLGESVEILTGACEMSTSGAAGDGPGGVHQSPASSPISYLWHQSTIQEPAKSLAGVSDQIAIDINESAAKNRINLSTSETAIFSTTPVSSGESGAGEGGSSANESPSTLSPIQKPQHSTTATTPSTTGAATTPTRTTTTTKGAAVESEGDIADCDTSSTTSGRSYETHSVSSGAQRKGAKSTEASCTSPSSVKEELKRLKFFEISLKEQIKDLSLQRDGLVMELQQLQEARPVLEKAYARTAHPTLIQRVNQLELRNRHLQNVIKQQQQYTESLMQQSWQQHQIELTDLHGRIENQGILISEQVQRLQNADILVKDLYVENSHLTATIQRFEQQRVRANMMQQQQQHHQQQQHIMQQQQLHALNGLAGMP